MACLGHQNLNANLDLQPRSSGVWNVSFYFPGKNEQQSFFFFLLNNINNVGQWPSSFILQVARLQDAASFSYIIAWISINLGWAIVNCKSWRGVCVREAHFPDCHLRAILYYFLFTLADCCSLTWLFWIMLLDA